MTIAERFASALDDVSAPGLAGAELLPVRLARACTRMLPVDDAGLSMMNPGGHRIPLGASSATAETAERLQFTVGSGPCMAAHESRQPVFAAEEDLRRRWPEFTALLLRSTPYRAVVALPLQPALVGEGAIDLYFERPDEVPALDVFEAMAVGELVSSALNDAAVWSEWSSSEGPEWLHGPVPRRRAAVWEAMGKLGVELEIGSPAALALLRAQATGSGVSVDEVAADVLAGRLPTSALRR
ncbi:GAF domain-containing protein [Blastococcus sp. PRF04-17]|uniref:GAF domain-containing protein n=1 Tax=Blastococcus sp. PRF04-17 TaxID=2933797 RepID=UPI001FF5EDE5|nr:GAF domain-containing protein [Blastococcus sp. PRF04-17]UOY03797.1 GAF domain-containing protein [Blastococcus sp. PRF04-17]